MKKTPLLIILLLVAFKIFAQTPVIVSKPQDFITYIIARDSVQSKLYLQGKDTLDTRHRVDSLFQHALANIKTYAVWDSISNKPSSFPPSAHTHPINQVVNLQSELDRMVTLNDVQTITGIKTFNASTYWSDSWNSQAVKIGTDGGGRGKLMVYNTPLDKVSTLEHNALRYITAVNAQSIYTNPNLVGYSNLYWPSRAGTDTIATQTDIPKYNQGQNIYFSKFPSIKAAGIGLNAFGNSITYGQGASVFDSSYVGRLSAYIGGPLLSRAHSGDGVNSQLDSLLRADTIPFTNAKASLWAVGINTIRYYANIQDKNRGVSYMGYAARAFMVSNYMSSVTYASAANKTGTWSAYTGQSKCAARSNGYYTQTVGDYITYNFSGTNFFFSAFVNSQDVEYYSDVEVYIDGNLVERVKLSALLPTSTYMSLPFIYGNLSNGKHTAVLKNVGQTNTPSLFAIDFMGTLRDPSTAPPSFVSSIYHVTAANLAFGSISLIDSANNAIKSEVGSFQKYGFGVRFIEVNKYYDTINTVDGVHPNDLGYRQIFQSYKNQIDNPDTYLASNAYSYTFSTGLTNLSGLISANVSTGIPGGQTIIGGTQSADNLNYSSTSHGTKGKHLWGGTGGMVYDEAQKRLRINQATDNGYTLEVNGSFKTQRVDAVSPTGNNLFVNAGNNTATGSNIAFGISNSGTGGSLTSGNFNLLMGAASTQGAARNLTSGSGNILFGRLAGDALTTHNNNTFIGTEVAKRATTNGTVAIGPFAGLNEVSDYKYYLSSVIGSNVANLCYGDFNTGQLKVNAEGYSNGATGTTPTLPPASAQFEVASITRGSIPAPRMAKAQRDAISSPVAGLLVFNTDNNKINYHNGSGWRTVADSADVPSIALASGTYTPTLTNQTNVASSSVNSAIYMRVGNIVHVSVSVNFQVTAANNNTVLRITVPVSAMTAGSGTVGLSNVSGFATASWFSGTEFQVNCAPNNTGTITANIEFGYTL